MKIRYYAIALVAVLALAFCGALFLLPVPQYKIDLTQINNITETLADHFEQVGTDNYLLPKSDYDYAVINNGVTKTQPAGSAR